MGHAPGETKNGQKLIFSKLVFNKLREVKKWSYNRLKSNPSAKIA